MHVAENREERNVKNKTEYYTEKKCMCMHIFMQHSPRSAPPHAKEKMKARPKMKMPRPIILH